MLRITLRDGEKAVINGAVLRACGRTELMLENDASVLRGRDVMAPEDANTPARRLYFACMMAYIDPQQLPKHQSSILSFLEQLLHAIEAPEAKQHCIAFARKVAQCDFYRALADCRALIAYEVEVLARLDQPDAA